MKSWTLLVASLLLSGCIATTQTRSDGNPGTMSSAEANGPDLGPTLSEVIADDMPAFTDEPLANDRRRAALAGYVPARLPGLEARTNAILRRLTEALPGSPEIGRVQLHPKDTFHAVSLPGGLIVLNLGAVLTLETDAEIAALLAHELTHVLAGHHAQLGLQDALDGALDSARAVEVGFSEDLDVDYGELERLQRATNGVMFPAWSRDQERAADRAAMDLLVLAGYSPDALLGLLETIAALTPETAEWSPLTAVRARAVLDAPERVGALEDVVDVAALRAGLETSLEQTVGADHDTAGERLRLAREYLIEHFGTLGPRPQDPAALAAALAEDADAIEGYLAVERIRRELARGMPARELRAALAAAASWPQRQEAYGQMVAARALQAMGDHRGAMDALEAAIETGHAPYSAYTPVVERRLAEGEVEAAAATLAMANERFDEPVSLLPITIALHSATGRTMAVLGARARCLSSMDSSLIARCNAAAE